MVYLEGLTAHMNPYPGPRSVLVIDNCRIHHVEGVQELCDERYESYAQPVDLANMGFLVASN